MVNINVTKSYLPNIKKFNNYIDKIYKNNVLTNNGPLCLELGERLSNYLDIDNLLLVQNGTLALQIAYKILKLKEEVITTPFSFVATTSSLAWEGLTPVFTDIDKKSLNLDAEKIESAINKKTTAIVPVHVFGNPCEIKNINMIAKKHLVKVIYDAAHAFGVKYNGSSILTQGDISILSFHATKIFHTIEGGAMIINDDGLFSEAKQAINFGYENGEILSMGINAKMNEFQAAMGLCVLDDIDIIIENNQTLANNYRKHLKDLVELPLSENDTNQNYAYFPILLSNEQELLKIQTMLQSKNIFPRRYFYPSLQTLPYIKHKSELPISSDISKRVLCLPIYSSLSKKDQRVIIDTIKNVSDY